MTGVVDWQSACTGPPAADVAHCRSNLFRYGLDVADRFTARWESFSGYRYDPRSEVVAIMDGLDGWREDSGPGRFVAERALARAVADLGGAP